MSKRTGAFIAIVLLSAPTVAAAKGDSAPAVQGVMACGSVTPDDARLRCYDQAIAALKQALAGGSVVLREDKGPRALEGVVKASGQSGANSYWVEFQNGDRWALTTVKTRRQPPRPGTTLKLKKTFFGNYWISGPGWSESAAEFTGREP